MEPARALERVSDEIEQVVGAEGGDGTMGA